jgi:hypothetical protein
MAVTTGLEPAVSGLTVQRSDELSYATIVTTLRCRESNSDQLVNS